MARRAGALLLDGLPRRHDNVTTKSSATDMVTDMDRASEALIVDGLLAARPDDAILAEEGSGRPGTSSVRWVIDPLDGTTNYLYGHGNFAVSIAAEIDGVTQVGVVAHPVAQEVFTAIRDGGASCNGEPIRPSRLDDCAAALVSTGFGYDPERRAAQAAVLAGVISRVRDVRRNGAAAIDLCWVGCGRLDAHYEAGLQPWDVAAGALIVTEAGGRVVGLDGEEPRSESILAATPELIAPLLSILNEAGVQQIARHASGGA